MDAISDYVAKVQAACLAGSSTGPRPTEFDNTSHAQSCSLLATPGAVAIFLSCCALKALLCPARRRALYAGSEDAPELEEVSTSAGTGRRVDSYRTKSGRLTSSTAATGASAAAAASSSGSGARRSKLALKRAGAQDTVELQPVLWGQR